MRILVMGFRPYGGEQVNASGLLVQSLRHRNAWSRRAVSLSYAILPTSQQLVARLPALLKRHRPTHLILFGQAPGRSHVCIEQLAHNNFQGSPIRGDGNSVLRTTLPRQMRMVWALCRAGIAAAPSDDAGDYYCNMALYLALGFSKRTGSRLRAGLVHIPVLPRQAGHHGPGTPSLSLQRLRQSARIILSVLAR